MTDNSPQSEPEPPEGFDMLFESQISYSAHEVEEHGVSPSMAEDQLMQYIHREGKGAGEFNLQYHDTNENEAENEDTRLDEIDFSEVGIWYIIPSGGGAGRGWLLPTKDEETARDYIDPWFDTMEGLNFYFEGTLDDALRSLVRDNCARLVD